MTTSAEGESATVTRHYADLDRSRLFYRKAGTGDQLLVLLHGWPQTSYCWRHVMQPLAEHYTVVAPDLPGYGRSSRSNAGYDKRSVAAELAWLVEALGYRVASIIGHDRGARVAHRWAIDHAPVVDRLVLLDVLPTRAVLGRLDRESASALWHWFFHLQPGLPELLIADHLEEYLTFFFERQTHVTGAIDARAVAEYVDAFRDPETLRCSLEDYRASFREDLDADESDARVGRTLTQPLLLLWGARGGLRALPVAEIWTEYAQSVIGAAIEECGHFLPEEQPDAVLRHLQAFLLGRSADDGTKSDDFDGHNRQS